MSDEGQLARDEAAKQAADNLAAENVAADLARLNAEKDAILAEEKTRAAVAEAKAVIAQPPTIADSFRKSAEMQLPPSHKFDWPVLIIKLLATVMMTGSASLTASLSLGAPTRQVILNFVIAEGSAVGALLWGLVTDMRKNDSRTRWTDK